MRVRRGQLHRRHRGVYAVGTGVLTMRGEMTAAVLACGDDATLSHWSAGAWWAMVRWDDRAVEVIVRRGAGRGLDAIRPRWSRSLEVRAPRHPGACGLRAVVADKQAILEANGHRVLRITWRQVVDHRRQTISCISSALAAAS